MYVPMTKKRGYRLHDGDQIPTVPITIDQIMAAPEFAIGVADARAGRAYHSNYEAWHGNRQWNYERGRQWARLVPRTVVLKRTGEITREAAAWAGRVFKDIR
jgi:hypothetical protein